MGRQWNDHEILVGGENGPGLFFWVGALVITLCLMGVVLFSCADGFSRDKASAAADDGGYAAACGTACAA